MKIFIYVLTLFFFSNLNSSVTHIWPKSGVQDTMITAHIFGDNFNLGITEVSLNKSGQTSINGSNISVVNDNYLTCDFNLNNSSPETYNVNVNSDTLDMCFTVNFKNISTSDWNVNDIADISDSSMFEISVGDGDNDGELEVYNISWDFHLYQLKYNGTAWNSNDLGSGGSYCIGLDVGDGNNDGDLEVFVSCFYDSNIYQFKFNGSSWVKTIINSTTTYNRGVAIGDGNNDGELEVYITGWNSHIYQFKYNGSTWVVSDLGSTGFHSMDVAVGDGNNDGELEVYATDENHNVYQFKYNGSSWNSTLVGSGGDQMAFIVVGDGDKMIILKYMQLAMIIKSINLNIMALGLLHL